MGIQPPFHLCIIAVLFTSCAISCSTHSAKGGLEHSLVKKNRPIVRQVGEPSPTAKKIVEFAVQNMGKKVGDGQCWGLANLAYRHAGIRHRGGYVWGRRIHWQTEGVRPGDIIQFENARYPYAYTDENHTAIILKVAGRSSVKVAHQHWNNIYRVTTTTIPLTYLRSGSQTVYRYEP
ncbi:CHAP domain-containing protein [Akkermansiaceae bacterium]|nr:CHAP domain-containing protein [Akkermansiaceae bacterium]